MPGSTPASGSVEADVGAFAPGQLLRRRMVRHRGLLAGAGVFGLIVLAALFAPLLAQHDPYTQNLALRLKPPAWDPGAIAGHPLGTDHLGRDYLARLLHGARISLLIGLTAASIGAVIGTTLGIVAGYFGGRVDQVVSYLLTCQLALPTLLLAMALVFLIGPSVPIVIAVIGLLHWSKFLVVARSATMQLRDLDFVRAARAFGSSRTQILVHELLPNLRNQVIVIFTLEVGIAIVAEASLSFLGVGVPSPTPSWGLMIAEGRNYMMLRPEVVLLPGIALFLLVVSINMMGDGLRDVTAPEARG